MQHLGVLAVAVVSLAVAAPVRAEDSEKEFVNRVNKSIDKGRKYLIEREGGKGNWEGLLLETLGDQVGGQSVASAL